MEIHDLTKDGELKPKPKSKSADEGAPVSVAPKPKKTKVKPVSEPPAAAVPTAVEGVAPPDTESHHLRTIDLLKLSLRAFHIRPMRSVLTILGISVGIGTVFFLVSLGYGLQFILVGQLATTEDSLVSLEAFYPTEGGLAISSTTLKDFASREEIAEISPVAEFPGEVRLEDLSGFLIVKMVDSNYYRLSGIKPDVIDDATEDDLDGIYVSNTALQLLGLADDETTLGKKINIKIFYQEEDEAEVKITEIPGDVAINGIIKDEFQTPFIYVPRKSVPDEPPFYQRVFVKAKDLEIIEPLRDSLINEGFVISARIDLVNQARKITTVITVVLAIFGVTALIVAAIGMFNTMIISFLERIFEVGIMKSIGATSQDIQNLFLMESTMMGLLGGIGGLMIGYTIAKLSNLGLNLLAKYLGGESISLFIFPLQFMIFIVILSAIVGASAGFWPARRAASLSAREAFLRK